MLFILYVFLCMFMCIYTCMFSYMCVCINIYQYLYTCSMYMYTYTYTCKDYIQYMCVVVRARIHIWVCIYLCTCGWIIDMLQLVCYFLRRRLRLYKILSNNSLSFFSIYSKIRNKIIKPFNKKSYFLFLWSYQEIKDEVEMSMIGVRIFSGPFFNIILSRL